MYYYRIAEVVLQSCYRLMSFDAFACEAARADITLDMTNELPPPGPDQILGIMYLRQLDDGWFFHFQDSAEKGLYVSADYTRLHMLGIVKPAIERMDEWFVRVAVECMLARKGCVSLHAAAVEAEGEAFAFTGPSGAGKSTRANAMMDELGAKMISGDRPLIDVKHLELYGVPWDGEEQCFRNVHYPLKAICEKMSVAELTDTLRPFFLREVDNNYELKSRVTLEEEQIDWISHFICTDLFGPF